MIHINEEILMNELLLFIKDNFYQLMILIAMLSYPNYRRLGFILTLLTMIFGFKTWLFVVIILFAVFNDLIVISSKNKTKPPVRKDPDYE